MGRVLTVTLSLLSMMAMADVTWTGKGDGTSWSDPNNWDAQAVPTAADMATFGSSVTGTITIDDTCVASHLIFTANTAGVKPVTFVGSGTLTASGTTTQIKANRPLVFDGPDVTFKMLNYAADVTIKRGRVSTSSQWKVSGDHVTCELLGGVLDVGILNCNAKGTIFRQRGGTLIAAGTLYNEDPEYHFLGGTFTWRGSNKFDFRNVAEIHLGLEAFNVSAGLTSTAADGTKIVFDRPVTLGGAASDFAVDDEKITGIEVAESLRLNAFDCQDGTTARKLTLGTVEFMNPAACLDVHGPGSVSVRLPQKTRLQALSVADGAVATVRSTGWAVLELTSFSLGASSSVAVSAGGVMIDAESATIDAAAIGLAVTVGSSFDSARMPVYSDLSSGTLPTVTLSGEKAGSYSVKNVGPFVYITDGSAVTRTANQAVWTGQGADDNWSTAANWNGKVPNDNYGTYAMFTGDDRNETVNDSDHAVTRVKFNTGSFTVTGNKIGVSSETHNTDNSAVYLGSDCPSAVYSDVFVKSGKKEATFMCASSAFLALMGCVDAQTQLVVSGDVRFGGVAICDKLEFETSKTSLKDSRVSVMNGGTLVVNNHIVQTNENKVIGYDVRQGGTLEIVSGAWDWPDVVTNRVDGLLKLGAVPSGSAAAKFSGRGTVELRGAALDVSSAALAFVAGSNTLSSVANTTLGAMTVAKAASLTLDQAGHVYTLTKTIVGDGKLVFPAGVQVALGGDLLADAQTAIGAEVASVGAIEGELTAPPGYKLVQCSVAGRQVVTLKAQKGLMLFFR